MKKELKVVSIIIIITFVFELRSVRLPQSNNNCNAYYSKLFETHTVLCSRYQRVPTVDNDIVVETPVRGQKYMFFRDLSL